MKKLPVKPTYKHITTGGLYRITYQAPSGAHRKGIPHDDKTDYINLVKVGGRIGSPELLVTSLFDFEERFIEVDLLTDDTNEAHSGEDESD